jgi:hypothetical protein
MYLFDEPPVTEAEVQEWLDRIPNLSASPFRREAYRKAYRVEEKIRAAKREQEPGLYISNKQSRRT